MSGAVNAKRASVVESEHVLAQSNVWEMRSEKQAAALRMEGGGTSDDELTCCAAFIICAAIMFILSTSLSPTQPERKLNWVRLGVGIDNNLCTTDN